MASTPFFGKRETSVLQPRLHQTNPTSGGVAAPAAATTTVTAAPEAAADLPAQDLTQPTPAPVASITPEGGSKLIVGPNIKLKGVEITDCDTLVVEGLVEATMDSRLMQIAEIGAFKGSAQIDLAEIRGSFEGDLTVRDKLVIHATGKVTGTIRYGKVVIEEGGQLSGDISFGTSDKARAATSKPALQMAA